jgi:hypothetical protein
LPFLRGLPSGPRRPCAGLSSSMAFVFSNAGVRGLVKIPFSPNLKNIYLRFVITFSSKGFMFIEVYFIATNKNILL